MRVSPRITATLLAGAALFAVSAAPALAQQAPAGEVEALRAQVQALMARIEKLEKAPSTPAGPPASKDAPLVSADVFKAPQVTQSGNSKVKLMLSGQVGRAVQFADDGFDSDTMFVDNSQSSSRVRVSGTAKLDDNWTAGSDIEFETSSGSSRNMGFSNNDGSGTNAATNTIFSINERKVEFWVQHKNFGRIWVGQGDTATNVTSEVDLSGTATLISHTDIGSLFGGVLFRNKATRAAGPNINAVFNNFDGLSRDDRVRYDTPTFGGFMLSTSFIEGGATDFAGRYTGKIGDTEVSGAIGYVDNDARSGFDTQTNGSVSVKFASGFNVTAAAGTRDIGPRDSDFWYGKLGYLANLTGLGNSSFVVDYLVQKDLAVAGGDAKAWSVGYVQTIDAFATDFYLSYRNHSYDTRTVKYKDINGVISGARVRF